jgi:predicted ATPase
MTDHPYKLRRIALRDFKSVAEASVELGPLTVVVGANSSGKSTLLQSILAVTQAVRADTNTADFPLNGEFVRLGSFEETRNFLSVRPDQPMEMGFELVTSPGVVGEDGDDQPLIQFVWRAYLVEGSADDAQQSSGFAHLASLEIEIGEIWPGSEGDATRLLSCDLAGFASADQSLNLAGERRPLVLSSTASRSIGATGRAMDWDSGASSAVDAVELTGGVPQSVMRRVRLLDRLAESWWNVAQQALGDELQAALDQIRGKAAPNKVSEAAIGQARSDIEARLGSDRSADLAGWRGAGFLPETDLGADAKMTLALVQLPAVQKKGVARSMAQLGEATFRALLREELADEEWVDDEILVEQAGRAGTALRHCSAQSHQFFRQGVRYLGPLREAPHVLYDPGPSKLDLGVCGEYTAAVLHAQARRIVRMPTPDGTGEERRLDEALDFWLQYLGLVEGARSEDRGRIGIGLNVTPIGLGREVDLTSVGVGVSQVLPVILLCLLAERGSLVILEQPELHLHPKLQQDLADFLLACSRSGRQIVLETHSEHLVNRLRLHIADDDTAETHDLVKLLFVENEQGITRYCEPEFNEYGGLADNWPAGFLDLTARESQELVRQSLAKRRRAEELESDVAD